MPQKIFYCVCNRLLCYSSGELLASSVMFHISFRCFSLKLRYSWDSCRHTASLNDCGLDWLNNLIDWLIFFLSWQICPQFETLDETHVRNVLYYRALQLLSWRSSVLLSLTTKHTLLKVFRITCKICTCVFNWVWSKVSRALALQDWSWLLYLIPLLCEKQMRN